MKWHSWHHLYLGFIIIIIGFIFTNLWVVGLGLLIMADDWFQHTFNFKSPLHRIYSWLYKRSKIIRDINQWFDDLFKKKGLP
jgi:uncharacterized membrane protein YbaN (DUF454 family)